MNLISSDLELVRDIVNQSVGIRFTGVDIPQGATIVNAYVQFQVDETTSEATSLTIEGEDIDDATPFTSSDWDISSRARTLADVSWSPEAWLKAGQAGTDQRTPDLSSVIQEIVNQSGWSIGNSLVVIITGTGKRVAESYDIDQGGAPLLHVEYNQPPTADAGPDQTVNEGDMVTLDASNSKDPDDGIAFFEWTQLSGPPVTFSDPTDVQPTIITPNVGQEGESLTVQLTVTDNGGLKSHDTCIVLIQPSVLPTVYEDAEDGSTSNWAVYDNTPSGATVSNVFDSDRGSRVIELSGSGAENSYRLYLEEGSWWHNSSQFVIEWSMKYSEDFTIYIYVETTAGRRWLDYTPVNYDDLGSGQHIYHGLGSDIVDGQWHTFVRDLQADLQEAQPWVSIVEVNGFLIRGSGFVDDIKLLRMQIWEGDYDINTEADLEALSTHTSITGNLSITDTSLTHLNGLERLLHIYGYLYIDNNAALESLEGLNNLESIGKGLWTDPRNPQNSFEMSLCVSNNAALTSLQGLDSLKSTEGGLSVWDNAALTSLGGLNNLTSIEGSLFITNNDNLVSLQDLSDLTSIGETSNGVVSLGLVIGGNDALEGLGLDNLNSVSKTFFIFSNPELCTSLAEHLRDQVISRQGIDGNINISGNKACP
jgi:hypothetical protein